MNKLSILENLKSSSNLIKIVTVIIIMKNLILMIINDDFYLSEKSTNTEIIKNKKK